MQVNDFFCCKFQGDNQKYIARVTNVNGAAFDCRFVHSGKQYRFSADTWKVLGSNGGFPPGTALSYYQLFSPGAGTLVPQSNVVVTFGDGNAYLGILESVVPERKVTFVHSGAVYSFDSQNKITYSSGAYRVGDIIQKIEVYRLTQEENITPSVAPAATVSNVNIYDPINPDTLVINKVEFPSGIAGFKNYQGWKNNPAIPHNKKPKTVRALTTISQLVLHETSADSGDGFDDSRDYTAHLSVLKNGTVLQFNDLVEKEYHVGFFNDTTIGVEFVNSDWVQGMPSRESSLTPAQREKYAEAKGYLWAFCGLGKNIYKLPAIDQLEKLLELINRLTGKAEEGFVHIEPNWLQLVSYNEVKDLWLFRPENIPSDASKRQLFIFSNADLYMLPAKQAGKSGIFSHASLSSVLPNGTIAEDAHGDGSFLSLYSWLRIEKGNDAATAYAAAQELIRNHHFFVRTKQTFPSGTTNEGRLIVLLDVSGVN